MVARSGFAQFTTKTQRAPRAHKESRETQNGLGSFYPFLPSLCALGALCAFVVSCLYYAAMIAQLRSINDCPESSPRLESGFRRHARGSRRRRQPIQVDSRE